MGLVVVCWCSVVRFWACCLVVGGLGWVVVAVCGVVWVVFMGLVLIFGFGFWVWVFCGDLGLVDLFGWLGLWFC